MASDKPTPHSAIEDQEQDSRICALVEGARVLGSVERVAILQQAVEDIGEVALNDTRKVELLDDIVELLIQTLAELSEEYLTTTLPLSEDQEALVRMALALTDSIDEQYAVIEPDQRDLDHRHILHRRLGLLLEQFTFSAACYMTWNPYTWIRIHQLYIQAWKHGATQYRAKSFVQGRKSGTIERLYVTAVLTAAADPYQMPHRDIHKARILAAAFAHLVKVNCYQTYVEAPEGQHRILADDRVDKPALPYRAGKELDHHNVVIEIEECYRTLSKRLESIRKDPRSKDPLFVNASRDTVIGVYQHVLVKWGWQPTRASTRVAINVDFDILVNYTNILEAFGEAIKNADPDARTIEPAGLVTVTSTNVSDSGIGLRVPATSDLVLRVGELVAMREKNAENEWRVAIVRWIRNADNGLIEVGTMKVPGRMQQSYLLGVHKMQTVGKTDPETHHLTPVLITSNEDSDGPTTAQLLVHRNMGKSDLVHWLSLSGKDRLIKSMKPFLGTRYVVIYTCELSEPRKKPFFDEPPEERYRFTFK